VTGGKPIAVLLQSISGVRAINPLVAFYDIHGGKREVLFFYFAFFSMLLRQCTIKDNLNAMILKVLKWYPSSFIYQSRVWL
jgi:hypothetical protein